MDFSSRDLPDSDHVRKMAPPEEHKIHTDERLAVAEDHMSPYERAVRYVEGYRDWIKPILHNIPPVVWEDYYETPLRVKMSRRDWGRLKEKLYPAENDDPYPRLSYNAATSTLTIQCGLSPISQTITTVLMEQFIYSTANLPEDLRDQTHVSWEVTTLRFGGRYSGSQKRPRLSINVQDAAGHPEPRWVVEAGLSETYDELVEDTKIWLEGHPTVAMVVLVKFSEVPKYRSPVPFDQDPEELGIPLSPAAIKEAEVTMEGRLGPATYKGLQWVGAISEVFLETWVQDGDGKAVRQGNREDLLRDGKFELSFGDILPPGYPQTISLRSDRFYDLLKYSIQVLAANRCADVVIAWLKRMGGGQSDRGYKPSE